MNPSEITPGKVAAVLGGLIALLAAWTANDLLGRSTVVVANPLDRALVVEFAGETEELPAESAVEFRAGVGTAHLKASRTDGAMLDEREIEVRRLEGLHIVNLFGAAPVTNAAPEVGVTGCGETELRWPEFAVLSHGSSGARLLPGGWRACLSALDAAGRSGDAARVARDVASVTLDDEALVEIAAQRTEDQDGALAAATWLRPMADRAPLDATVVGLLDGVLHRAGLDAERLSRFTALYKANPQSPLAARLHAAAEPTAEAVEADLREALARWPTDVDLNREIGRVFLARGRYAEAAAAFTRIGKESPADLEAHATALVGAAEAESAVALLAPRVKGAPKSLGRLYIAAAHRAVRPSSPGPDEVRSWLRTSAEAAAPGSGEAAALLLAASLGEPVAADSLITLAPPDRALLTAGRLLLSDPDAARTALADVADADLARFYPVQWVLLRGEAMRSGDTALQVRLDRAGVLPREAAAAARDVIAGHTTGVDGNPLPPELAAAAWLERARQPGVAVQEAADARKRALQLDFLQTLVSRALADWR